MTLYLLGAFHGSNRSGSTTNKSLLVTISVNKPVIIAGSNQTLELMVSDNKTGQVSS